MTGHIEASPTNQAAFLDLENAMASHGRPFKRGEIVPNPSRPDDIVAVGLEREISVLTQDPFDIGGKLSVRALMTNERAEDIVRFAVTPQHAVNWLFRTRLTFFVPPGRHTNDIASGAHMAGAVYLLSSDGPKRIDEVSNDPESTDQNDKLKGFVETSYLHSLPSDPDALIDAHDNSDRTKMLRKWFNKLPRNDGMMMISPTSAGEIGPNELPATIAWLLKDPY